MMFDEKKAVYGWAGLLSTCRAWMAAAKTKARPTSHSAVSLHAEALERAELECRFVRL